MKWFASIVHSLRLDRGGRFLDDGTKVWCVIYKVAMMQQKLFCRSNGFSRRHQNPDSWGS